MTGARITRIAGALAEAHPARESSLYEQVLVGDAKLPGEVIQLQDETATIQVHEETTGLTLDEPVVFTGAPLTAQLGPGLLGSVLDGVGRPLVRVAEATGDFLLPGTLVQTLDANARWSFEAAVAPGVHLSGGDVVGAVEEPGGFVHRIMVPPGTAGVLASIESGDFGIADRFGALEDGTPLSMSHRWPVRIARPVMERLRGDRPFITGQRVFDFLFPVAEGGAVAVPGGFGTGKTVIEQSLAKFAEADVIVYIGCGERGNEMAEVLREFPALIDPRTGKPVMDRAVLVVNTSNMPVAAREASIGLGFTIAEYYRDMGYRVAVMADSLSRWAEALREISARLQQMPGEEGYPTYLSSRLGMLYERAGRVRPLGAPSRAGAITFISAVSPPGGDFSEPVTQASLRVARAMWALDPSLANQRQFPAVDWETSYSLDAADVTPWFVEHAGSDWADLRGETLLLLQREVELLEIAGLVGPDALEDSDRLVLEAARLIRELVIGQSAFDPVDAFCPVAKTYGLASLAIAFYRRAAKAVQQGLPLEQCDVAAVRRAAVALRSAPEAEIAAKTSAADHVLEVAIPLGAA